MISWLLTLILDFALPCNNRNVLFMCMHLGRNIPLISLITKNIDLRLKNTWNRFNGV